MKRVKKLIVVLSAIFIFIAAFWDTSQSVSAQETPTLLIRGRDLTSMYDQESDYDNRSDYENEFGAWVIQPVGNKLYLALGGTPNDQNGAQIVYFENDKLTNIPVINKGENRLITEQGINDLHWSESLSKLIVPGTDPNDKNAWDCGTMYTYTPSEAGLKKYREGSSLTGVVHTWGVTEHKGALYIASHSSSGNRVKVPIGIGEVLKSTDEGQNWQRITQDPATATSPDDFFGGSVDDVISFNDGLYVLKRLNTDVSLQVTRDDGKTWKQINSYKPYSRPRMIVYKNQLLFIGRSANTISAIDTAENEHLYGLPQRVSNGYNVMTTDNNYVYYVGNDAKVYYSDNLKDWNVLAEIGTETLNAISYWPERQGIVVATIGQIPNIYFLPQQEPPQVITKSCAISINKNSFNDTEKLSVSINGKSSKGSAEPVRLFLKKVDNTKISPIPSGTSLVENQAAKTNYYQFGDSVCVTGNEESCRKTIDIDALQEGSYQLHCDLPDQPNSCSGNPNCAYKGGPFGCEGWQACGAKDSVSFTVTKKVVVPPTIQSPDYNKNGAVDIYDFNQLIQNYGKTDCSVNLVGDCKLDYTDVTKLISAYGKLSIIMTQQKVPRLSGT